MMGSEQDSREAEGPDELRTLRERVAALEAAAADQEDQRQKMLAGRAFLATVSRRLSASLDYDTVVETVVQLGVQHLGEGCVLVRLDAGRPIRIALAHADPDKHALLQELHHRYPIELPSAGPLWDTLSTGHTTLVEPFTLAQMREVAHDDAEVGYLRDTLALHAALNVALVCRGKIIGALSFFSSAARHLQQIDGALAEEMAHHVAIALDNARLYREAHEAIRARDEFLSIASHELRSPLNTLQLQAQILLRTLQRDGLLRADPARLLTLLENSERQTRRLGEIVDHLFDVTRISAGRLDLNLEDVDLGAVVSDVVARLEPGLHQAGCEVTLKAEGGVIGQWDRLRLEQVATNLITNAMKYGRGRPIHVTVARAGAVARLSVADQGTGIAPADRERIFARFERVADRRTAGLGLGLYIVRKVLDALGGSVRVEGELGRGATFVVDLPLPAGMNPPADP